MNCYKKLLDYIDNQYGKNNRLTILRHNSLDLVFEPFLELTDKESFSLALKREANIFIHNQYIREINCIVENFKKCKIEYILLKGISLANLLYNITSNRIMGDIDIYVGEKNLAIATNVLEHLGYIVNDAKDDNLSQHITLNKDNIEIELHWNVLNPKLNIAEDYLTDNTMLINIGAGKYRTTNYTSTLLHLLYHIYMHYNDAFEYYNISKTFICGCPTRNDDKLYRYFEIALFIEKYGEKICWLDVSNDVMKQNLTGNFREIIYEISYIFDDIFPSMFLNMIEKKAFTITCLERDLPEYLQTSHEMKTFDSNKILSYVVNNCAKSYTDKEKSTKIDKFFVSDPIYVNTYLGKNDELYFSIAIPKTILKNELQKIVINYIVFSNSRYYLYNNIEQHFSSDYRAIYQDWFQNGVDIKLPISTTVFENFNTLTIKTNINMHDTIDMHEDSFINLIIDFVCANSTETYTLSKKTFNLYDPRGFIKINKNESQNIPCRICNFQ